MDKSSVYSFVLASVPVAMASATTQETMNIVLLIIGIIGGVLSIGISITNIAKTFATWLKKATADDTITKEEVSELIEGIKPDVQNIVDKAQEVANDTNSIHRAGE